MLGSRDCKELHLQAFLPEQQGLGCCDRWGPLGSGADIPLGTSGMPSGQACCCASGFFLDTNHLEHLLQSQSPEGNQNPMHDFVWLLTIRACMSGTAIRL